MANHSQIQLQVSSFFYFVPPCVVLYTCFLIQLFVGRSIDIDIA